MEVDRLHLASYPFVRAVSARFSDTDAMHHVNNVAIAGWFEEARVSFNRRMITPELRATVPPFRVLARHVELDYLAEIAYPGEYRVGAGVATVGRTSWTLGLGIFDADGSCRATCDTTLVHTGAEGPTALPDPLREALSAPTAALGRCA